MNSGFWKELNKPFFVLAPMADVTDTVFRQIIAKHSHPDAMFTEFVSCDGLCSKGKENLLHNLQFVPSERPIVAQVFGATPKHFYETAKLIVELGFGGIDINMGCPDKAIIKQGAGSALILNPTLAKEIIQATQEGAGEKNPVSVKTRLGYAKDEAETWIPALLEMKLPALTIHGRTVKEMSKVPARWDRIKDVVEMAKDTGTLIIGNGDVASIEEAHKRVKETGVDGVMLGRAVFGNPWLFNKYGVKPSLSETLQVLSEHTQLFEKTWGKTKSFDLMKKHYGSYISGFPGAKELRMQLMTCKNAAEIAHRVQAYIVTKS